MNRFASRVSLSGLGIIPLAWGLAAPIAWADVPPTPNQLVITEAVVDTDMQEVYISGANFCAEPQVELAGAPVASLASGDLIVAELPTGLDDGDFLLTVDCGRGNKGFDAWELTIGAVGPPGPAGEPGPEGPPGPTGLPAGFYVVEGATKTIAASTTDVETLNCAQPGDGAISWMREGYGLVAGPGVSGFQNVVPVLTGTQPTGFTITFICNTAPNCVDVTHRIICADLTP